MKLNMVVFSIAMLAVVSFSQYVSADGQEEAPISAQELFELCAEDPELDICQDLFGEAEIGWSCLFSNEGCKKECKELGEKYGYCDEYWDFAYCTSDLYCICRYELRDACN